VKLFSGNEEKSGVGLFLLLFFHNETEADIRLYNHHDG
jgi:hypothetical protein